MTTYYPRNANVAFELFQSLEVIPDLPPGQVWCINTTEKLMEYLENCECVMVSNKEEKVYVFCLENGKIKLDIIDA